MPQEETTGNEKLELLKRVEVRTMIKDIARIREQEAFKERERIQSAGGAKPANPVFQEPTAPLPASSAPANLFQLPELPSVSQKILVRTAIGIVGILVLLNLAIFLYWRFVK